MDRIPPFAHDDCGRLLFGSRTSFTETRFYPESRVLANDDREAAEQAAAIIIGKWSDPED